MHILYKVEGKEVTGKDLSKVVSKVKGEKGTTVELTVLRGEGCQRSNCDCNKRYRTGTDN